MQLQVVETCTKDPLAFPSLSPPLRLLLSSSPFLSPLIPPLPSPPFLSLLLPSTSSLLLSFPCSHLPSSIPLLPSPSLLATEINLKQQLVEQLEKAQRSLYTMKQQYEDKMQLLQQQIRSVEAERDKVLKDISEGVYMTYQHACLVLCECDYWFQSKCLEFHG